MTQVIDEPRVSLELVLIEEVDDGERFGLSHFTVCKSWGDKPENAVLEMVDTLHPKDYWKYQVEKFVDGERVDTTPLLDWLRQETGVEADGQESAMTQVIDEPRVSLEEVSVLQLIYIKETVVGDDIERDYITVERAEGQLPEQQILNRVLRFDVEDYWKYQVEKSVDADDWPVDQAGLEDWLRTLTVRHISGEQPASRIVRWVQEGWEPMRFILEDGQLLSANEAVVVTEGGPLEAPASPDPDPDRYRNAILVDPDGRYLRYHSRRGGLEYTQRADEAQRYYPSEAAQIAAKTIFKVVTLPVDNRAYRAMEDKVSEFARQVAELKAEIADFADDGPEVLELQEALFSAGWAAYGLEKKLDKLRLKLGHISSVAMSIGIEGDLNKAAEGLDE